MNGALCLTDICIFLYIILFCYPHIWDIWYNGFGIFGITDFGYLV